MAIVIRQTHESDTYVWDSNTMMWVKMTQPLIDAGTVNVAGPIAITAGAPSYDSGLTAVPDTLTAVTASTIRALGILLVNLTASAVAVTVTNTAGTHYLKSYPLQGHMTVLIPLEDVTMVGVKWQAGAAASVNAQIWGNT